MVGRGCKVSDFSNFHLCVPHGRGGQILFRTGIRPARTRRPRKAGPDLQPPEQPRHANPGGAPLLVGRRRGLRGVRERHVGHFHRLVRVFATWRPALVQQPALRRHQPLCAPPAHQVRHSGAGLSPRRHPCRTGAPDRSLRQTRPPGDDLPRNAGQPHQRPRRHRHVPRCSRPLCQRRTPPPGSRRQHLPGAALATSAAPRRRPRALLRHEVHRRPQRRDRRRLPGFGRADRPRQNPAHLSGQHDRPAHRLATPPQPRNAQTPHGKTSGKRATDRPAPGRPPESSPGALPGPARAGRRGSL